MKQILKVIDGIYNNKELRNNCIPLLISNPGMGKTTLIHEYFKNIGKKCITVIASTKMPHEFAGVSIPDHNTKRMTYFDYDALLDLEDGDGLFLDEILNANPMILNAFLTVLEDRILPSGKKLADIMIMAAANPQGAVPLTPQIAERFIWYYLKFDIDYKESWKRYMAKYLITDNIFEQLCVLVQNESFNSSDKNYFTPRSIEKAIKMILAGVNTPYEKKLTPILNEMIMNNTGKDITLGETTWKANEMISWLKLQKLKNETDTIK